MRAVISIEHPAWAHQFNQIIKKIGQDGEILVLAVDKDGDLKLLDLFGIKYIPMAGSTGRNVIEKTYLFIKLCITYTWKTIQYKPDIIIGRASPMLAIASLITGIPQVIFEDTEVSRFSLNICKRVAKKILTPTYFLSDLGKPQVRLPMYKELFYLHEEVFKPSRKELINTNIDLSRPYVLIRFVSWNASHDVGRHGMNDTDKISFVKKIAEFCSVYISSEGKIPSELEEYRLKAPYDKIHHVIYYATMVISEGTTTASEAVVLGTHVLYLSDIICGTTLEQENKFKLLTTISDPDIRYREAINLTREMINDQKLWIEGKQKRKKLMREMPNPNKTYYEYLREYAERNKRQ